MSKSYDEVERLSVTNQETMGEYILDDSGCSFHMSPNKYWFETLKTVKVGKVLLGNNKACTVKGVGTIRIKMEDGMKIFLLVVRFFLELKKNSILLGLLDELGYSIKAQGGAMKVIKVSLVVIKGVKRNKHYVLQRKSVTRIATTTTEKELEWAELWHLWLGHVRKKKDP